MDGLAALTVAPSVSENTSATLITAPAISKEETVTPAALADEPADHPTPPETTGDVRSPTEPEYLKWVKVYLSCVVTSMGSIPSNLEDLRWHCCNHSSSQQKRAWCHLEEEQQTLRGVSSSASPGTSTLRGGRPRS